ncbi:hypothetical protein [Anaeromyxobacter paludicola]|uniref:Glycosyltransferase RgtA/B/C/D-like domain-containing protein n=1 Tax=Anaeromyxobacter paludicola TaxID=2918171 RepID=A0ABN6N8H1_9BACT|nr:hypothetical protein [Anaeromyxobacter paludicola]BDG09515.1 hypothetical protein AMPC_26280 [Anaeromyxobacter paludicola]
MGEAREAADGERGREPPGEAPRLEGRLALGAAALLGGLAALRLWAAYPLVENRLALGPGAAARAAGDLAAAEALRHLRLLELGRLLLAPEPWPTLRRLLAAPALALGGPSPAAESAVNVALYALLPLALAWAVRAFAPREPLGAAGVAALALLAHAGLLGVAASGRLEVLAALCLAGALGAWGRYRAGGAGAPIWPLALLANALFLASPRDGALLALSVLAVEGAALPPAAWRKGGPRRLRRLGVPLAGPMLLAALLPPWRVAALLAAPRDASAAGPLGALRATLVALLREGAPRPARVAVALGLAAALTAALRVPAARRRMLPLLAFGAAELAALALGAGAREPRAALVLVPLVALLLAAPLQPLPPVGRAALALPMLGLLAAAAGPAFSPARLPAALSAGFGDVAVQDACVTLSGLVPPVHGALVNAAPAPLREDCALDLAFEAAKQGVRLDVRRGRPARGDPEALDLAPGCRPPPPELDGFEPVGPPALAGPLCAQRYERR